MAWSKVGNLKGPQGDPGSGTGLPTTPDLTWGPSGAQPTLDASGLTADRTLTLPDLSGQIALTGQIVNVQTGTTYTLAIADANNVVAMHPAANAACALTVPSNASVAFPIGTRIAVPHRGYQYTQIVAASGVTIQNAFGQSYVWDGLRADLLKVDTDTWQLSLSRSLGQQIGASTLSSGTLTLDMSTGDYFSTYLNQNVTALTLSNLPANTSLCRTIALVITQDSTGSRTFALPSSFYPIGNSDTAIQSAASAQTLMVATTISTSVGHWQYSMGKTTA